MKIEFKSRKIVMSWILIKGAIIALIIAFLEYIHKLLDVIVYLLPAIVGGLVDAVLEAKEKGIQLNFKSGVGNVLVSGFSGMLTWFLCKHFGISDHLMSFLVGISGWGGVRSLKFFENMTKAIIVKLSGLRFTDVKKEEKLGKTENVKTDNKEVSNTSNNNNDN